MNGPAQADGDLPQDSSAAVVREIEIINKKGLHARASAKFVQTAEQFDAAITVSRGHESVGGTSIMGLMMLAAGPGITITIQATGKEAAAAVNALCALIASRFGSAHHPHHYATMGYASLEPPGCCGGASGAG
jgi:phosphocarrier protein